MPDPDHPDRRRLRVAVVDGRGRPARAPGLVTWLREVLPARTRGRVTIALLSDARVRALNRTYRRKDAVTDVLSFPSDADGMLGDVAIATGLAVRQARAQGHSVGTELRILALHGVLHLMGYDHERDRGEMRRLEARLRRKGGLEAGLIERAR